MLTKPSFACPFHVGPTPAVKLDFRLNLCLLIRNSFFILQFQSARIFFLVQQDDKREWQIPLNILQFSSVRDTLIEAYFVFCTLFYFFFLHCERVTMRLFYHHHSTYPFLSIVQRKCEHVRKIRKNSVDRASRLPIWHLTGASP